MDISILNPSTYEVIDVIDVFISFIWTDRYYKYGDFELLVAAQKDYVKNLLKGNILSIQDSDRMMIIETLATTFDAEEGLRLKITGRSLESILDRRIIWGQKSLKGNFQEKLEELLNENAISPEDQNRIIPGLVFSKSDDPRITAKEIDTQFFGDNLYDAVMNMCADRHLGWRILPIDGGGYKFELYFGHDRSYRQEDRPTVLFAPSYDNLLNTSYLESDKNLKTVALAAGEGEGSDRKILEVFSDEKKVGLERREFFADIADVSSKSDEQDEEGNYITLSDEEYYKKLASRAKEELYDHRSIKDFSGEVDTTRQFVYNVDFFIGDIAQIENELGHSGRVRIDEVIRSYDESGEIVTPGFSALPEKEIEIIGLIRSLNDPFTIPEGMYDGNEAVEIDPDKITELVPMNIRQGVTMLGVRGEMSGTESVKSQSVMISPSTDEQVIYPFGSYEYISSAVLEPISYETVENPNGSLTAIIGS